MGYQLLLVISICRDETSRPSVYRNEMNFCATAISLAWSTSMILSMLKALSFMPASIRALEVAHARDAFLDALV